MIEDLDETLRQLLIAELPVKNGEIDVSFDQPAREWSSRLSKPTVNLFLYDVRENNVLRQHQWERLNNGNRQELAKLKRSPVRVDCSYMLSTWAADAEDEHRLLSRLLLTLFRFPILPAARLVGALQDPPFDIQTKIAQRDVLTDPSDLWNVLDNEIRPSVPYVITLALDPWEEITGPLVRTRILRVGQAQNLPFETGLKPDEARVDLVLVAGVVRDRKDKTPRPGVDVAFKGTGFVATTDDRGRFTLGSVPPGTYTLVAWEGEEKPQQKQIEIPGKEGDYDIDL